MPRSRRRNKTRNVKDEKIETLEFALSVNTKATMEGGKRKSWNEHDMNSFKPITENQSEMFESYFQGLDICTYGYAGTGKTVCALYLASTSVFANKTQDRIIIVRSSVPSRDVGFLPGTAEEKAAQYEMPYRGIMYELFGKQSTYDDMKAVGKIEFLTTSFVRGITLDNAIIILDETQNMTFQEIDSVLTRVGKNTRVILCGDVRQTDLVKKSSDHEGMTKTLAILKKMENFDLIEFGIDDIVRSGFVKNWIIASSEL